MTRSLVLGNGNIFVGFDKNAYVREFYFPFVGLENHIAHNSKHRIGLWVDNTFSWLDEKDWKTKISCPDDTLTGKITKVNESLGISLHFEDVVYNEKNIFIRKIAVSNQGNIDKEVTIFFGQEFELYESDRGDTAYYDPETNSVIHYKGQRVFLVNAKHGNKPFTEYTTGIFNIYGKEGSFRDAEDGNLQKNPIEHGPCDSVIGLKLKVKAKNKEIVEYWLCVSESIAESKDLNKYILEKTPDHLIETTNNYWKAWINRSGISFGDMPKAQIKLFQQSLFYTKVHIDKRGAIIASGDTSMLQAGKDTYSYMWPRDAAFVTPLLDQTGDHTSSQRFFEFCNGVLTPEGYLMHKYLPDQSLGSSWHPWIRDGKKILPIQEDETALVLFALKKHYEQAKDLEFIEKNYNSLIKKIAIFLIDFKEPTTGLPKPSYDLWEEKYGIHTFTVASVYGALKAASFFAKILGKEEDACSFNQEAEKYKTGLLEYLFVPEQDMFRKSIIVNNDNTLSHDDTIDASSSHGVFIFGVLDPHDPRLKKAMSKTEKILRIRTKTGGIARYTGDAYFRSDKDTAGNPWVITTMWHAQYNSVIAEDMHDLASTQKSLAWAVNNTNETGILPEQLNPKTGEHLSSTPLTWSHAEYAKTVLEYLNAKKRIENTDY